MIPFYSAPIESGTSISQFCSVVVPVYFFYLLMLYAFGEKLAQHLIKADRFSENRFIIRPFSIVGTVFTSCFFVFSAGYFLLFKVFHLAAFFGFPLFGYLWVKVNTYCVLPGMEDEKGDSVFRHSPDMLGIRPPLCQLHAGDLLSQREPVFLLFPGFCRVGQAEKNLRRSMLPAG